MCCFPYGKNHIIKKRQAKVEAKEDQASKAKEEFEKAKVNALMDAGHVDEMYDLAVSIERRNILHKRRKAQRRQAMVVKSNG